MRLESRTNPLYRQKILDNKAKYQGLDESRDRFYSAVKTQNMNVQKLSVLLKTLKIVLYIDDKIHISLIIQLKYLRIMFLLLI